MRNCSLVLLFVTCFSGFHELKGQNLKKAYLEQGFEYYFATKQYEQAVKALEILHQQHDLRSVKLDYALKVAVKFKRDKLITALLEESFSDFNENLPDTEAYLGEWLGDTTFQFAKHYGKKWPAVSRSVFLKKQQFEDNLKSEYYSSLLSFLNVDQFVRFNQVSPATFNQVDSINLDNFCNWLLEYPRNAHIKSRLNNQMMVALLRHLGAKRYAKLEAAQVFSALLAQDIISAQDFGLLHDYVHPKAMYFVEYDAFVEKSWDKSGIKTKAEIQARDQSRRSIGLLPMEYSGFCLQKGIVGAC